MKDDKARIDTLEKIVVSLSIEKEILKSDNENLIESKHQYWEWYMQAKSECDELKRKLSKIEANDKN